MNILAFDTSTDLLCGCLLAGGQSHEWCLDAGLHHAELLMGVIDSVCRQAGVAPNSLNAIVTGRGPGSFTGLRIGMATAKGMAESLGVPLASVSALDAMAQRNKHWPGHLLCLMDARKHRFYAAIYRNGHRLGAFLDLDVSGLLEHLGTFAREGEAPVLVSGPHTALFFERLAELPASDDLRSRLTLTADPCPRKGWGLEMALLGKARIDSGNWDPVDFSPEYVRDSDAEISISAKASSARL